MKCLRPPKSYGKAVAMNAFSARIGSLFAHRLTNKHHVALLPMSGSQSKEPAPPSQLQADAIQALLVSSSKKQRPKQRSASSFGEQAELADESSTNKCSLLCPKEGCGSLILKPGIAILTPNKQAPASIPRLANFHFISFLTWILTYMDISISQYTARPTGSPCTCTFTRP
jgi:hypothetical protein